MWDTSDSVAGYYHQPAEAVEAAGDVHRSSMVPVLDGYIEPNRETAWKLYTVS